MRELTLIGLDVDGHHIICEGGDPADKFLIRVDDRLRAAVRGERPRPENRSDSEVRGVLRPRDIQARIRAGASVEEVAEASGMDLHKVARFANPVLLERQRAAELATAAHPVLADGPAVATLMETVAEALSARGQGAEATTWDAWRTDDGRWTIRMGWQAGLSENVAHFRFTPGAHGGTVTAIDEAASELIDPEFERPLRPVAPLPQLPFEDAALPAPPAPAAGPEPGPRPTAASRGKRKPAIPAWEDVLLGVRSSGQ